MEGRLDLRYQVFISSTYADLKDERQKVTQTLMEMDCIPAGMELFPAADEEQWEFIKKVINDCDYYILIIGGRYGSTTREGISYTEKEYDYAVQIGLKVVAFLHEDPAALPKEKCEADPELLTRLEAFRTKVSCSRLVKFWKRAEDLPGMVALSLQKTIKAYPARGWIRAGGTSNEKLLGELNDLRKENNSLKSKLQDYEGSLTVSPDVIAGLEENFKVSGTYTSSQYHSSFSWEYTLQWGQIFGLISPYVNQHPNQEVVYSQLARDIFALTGKKGYSIKIEDQILQTIGIQFKALGLITIKYNKTVSGSMSWFWFLTKKGEKLMLDLRVIKKNLRRDSEN